MDGNIMAIIWGVLLLLFIVIEAITVQMVSIWFGLGALAAIVAVFCGGNSTVQIISFLAVSTIALIATRPLVKKFLNSKTQSTNADRNIGQIAVVTDDIDNVNGKGQVIINGLEWTARTDDNSVAKVGENVLVEKIEGVKLIVRRMN